MDNTNNQATVIGTIEDDFKLNHEIYAERRSKQQTFGFGRKRLGL